ncbi:hypothetical protein [Mycobacterium aquaticum]|uniref:Helix-turn-helix domain-containing protein n=1 Tax=Mycobacterium aquaticum TaxID=1927124 RepID=A0A1X0ACI1_9MYCO|nr:hypothetical protein [Mycobacterium aquaticum]ORA27396.1 hypothetical protein BST13_30530 [Mycobacterium aquaticum]
MSASPTPSGYMSRTAAAAELGWYPQRVTAAIKRGALPAYEQDGQVLVREADVRALAAKLTAEPRPLDPKEL